MTERNGKVAIVTGASRGIGRATATRLAAEGTAVVVNYRSGTEEAADVVAEIASAGGRAVAVQADVSDPQQAEAMVASAIKELGGIDILVNNAGVTRDVLIPHMEPDDWQFVMNVNFGGMFNCIRAALPHMMSQRNGTIVNVSSVMGERGWVGQANYSASKGAMNAYTRCAAVELARFGIRVNAVLPGFVVTDLVADLVDKGGKGIKRQVPMRQLAELDDVTGTIAFLSGPDSGYMTGSCLTVDGGASAQLGLGRPQ